MVGDLARPEICRQGLSTARWLREIRMDAHVHLSKSGSGERTDGAITGSQCYGTDLYISIRRPKKK